MIISTTVGIYCNDTLSRYADQQYIRYKLVPIYRHKFVPIYRQTTNKERNTQSYSILSNFDTTVQKDVYKTVQIRTDISGEPKFRFRVLRIIARKWLTPRFCMSEKCEKLHFNAGRYGAVGEGSIIHIFYEQPSCLFSYKPQKSLKISNSRATFQAETSKSRKKKQAPEPRTAILEKI